MDRYDTRAERLKVPCKVADACANTHTYQIIIYSIHWWHVGFFMLAFKYKTLTIKRSLAPSPNINLSCHGLNCLNILNRQTDYNVPAERNAQHMLSFHIVSNTHIIAFCLPKTTKKWQLGGVSYSKTWLNRNSSDQKKVFWIIKNLYCYMCEVPLAQ
jgi:hypothetical protein